MRISIYVGVKNALYLDYHFPAMLRHHLPLADEIIVHDGMSTDGTAEAVRAIDPKITVMQTVWGPPRDNSWFAHFKDEARRRCTGDWCIMLDADEFIPEWEFDRLRRLLATTDKSIVPLEWTHFYGNYKVYHGDPGKARWPVRKWQVHRNLPEMHIWGDGSHVRLGTLEYDQTATTEAIPGHHFGMVRKAARLRQKLSVVGRMKATARIVQLPSLLFNLRPYDWFDEQFLPDLRVYDGPYVKAVLDEPDEFVRDGMKLHRHLVKQLQAKP